MKKPAFTRTTQIGIVVRDLDATIRRYEDDYGIGPWNVAELNAGSEHDLRIYGKPAKYSCRFAAAMIGYVQWELIQPLDDHSLFARFLAEKGEGVHHIAVLAPNYDETLAIPEKQGKDLALQINFGGIDVAYLPTDRDLGVLIEVFKGFPLPEETWGPAPKDNEPPQTP